MGVGRYRAHGDSNPHQHALNSVESWAKYRGIDPIHAMNILQEHGVISDNCVHIEDIGNHFHAMKWLASNYDKISDSK